MQPHATDIPGCIIWQAPLRGDERGNFLKRYHEPSFAAAGCAAQWRECFQSWSRRDVIRGMHFQLPPHDHAKLVSVAVGSIRDVILDLRVDSPAFGRWVVVELDAEDGRSVFIPRGCAHGFLATSEQSLVHYLVETAHHPDSDRGIRYDGFGYDWGVAEPILSQRDRAFPTLAAFDSPFRLAEEA